MLTFPSTQEITHIVRNTVTDPTRYIGAQFCPIVDVFSRRIEVDVLEATTGMTAPHNLNAPAAMVKQLSGQSTKIMATAYWKEAYRINEEELLFAREEGTYNKRAGRLRVVRRATELNTRLETRIEWLRWQPLVGGKVAIDENNVKYTVDYKVPSRNKPSLDWSDPNHDVCTLGTSLLSQPATGSFADCGSENVSFSSFAGRLRHLQGRLRSLAGRPPIRQTVSSFCARHPVTGVYF
jgi:hypothetical protein